MKNLNICNVTITNLDICTHNQKNICYGYNEETADGEVFACSHNLVLTKFLSTGERKWGKDLSQKVSSQNAVVNITFMTINNELCVGLSDGEIFAIGNDEERCNLAGVCEGGLLAMEWSPDQEIVVLVTKENKMILMSCTFDPIQEVSLTDNDFGEKEFITVGWGKKETQFHGSEGKQAAASKVEVTSDPNALNLDPRISWRGDGQLYAVGFTVAGIRVIKIFDRDGHLQCTSEKQPGLEENLSWRPSGNVIATTQKLQDKYVVAFFEKNGLKHGGFDIPVNSTTNVKNLHWSTDSEIIALHCVDAANGNEKILLFTTGNYHWYLKQTIVYRPNQKIIKMFWDTDFDVAKNKTLHLILDDGLHVSYTWIWSVEHSTGNGEDDDAVVGIVDGAKVLLTGFRQTVVPSPMAALEINLDSCANEIHFLQNKEENGSLDSNTFFVITEDSTFLFYKQTNKFPLQYELFCEGAFTDYAIPFECHNWFWLNEKTITCIQNNTGSFYLLRFAIDLKGRQTELKLQHFVIIPDSVMRTQINPIDRTKMFLHLSNGEIIDYSCDGIINPVEEHLPIGCPKFEVLYLNNEFIFCGLSYKGILYFNDTAVMKNVSSCFVHSHFLLLTTLQHVLLCTELSKTGINAIKEYEKTESPHVYKRKIERGAKLVVAVPNATRTVFQMPRGNLEAIQPRPLSLKIIGEYLDACKYHEAFDLMRKQRINLNLIFDHCPEKFMKNVDVFLDDVKHNSWLSLFISDLDNVDVTKTMYASSYAERNFKNDEEGSSKIIKICDIIRAHIGKRSDRDNKILPLLTTFVKKNTVIDLEEALGIIKELKSHESSGSKMPVGSDEALKYLLYMVDVNNLFNVALGMYDFDLVLLVASKSQKDPKEYVPMLNELNEMEENFKRFSVNKHLKRFDRAVECLAKCGPEKYDDLKSFVKYHSLYRQALELFTSDDEIYKQISDDFGLYLKLQKQFVEAGIVYRRAGSLDKAIECFIEAVEWELAIELALTLPEEKFQDICQDLIKSLRQERRHNEAHLIMEQYCDNTEDSIIYSIKAGQYKTALRLCSNYDRADLRDNHLLPAICEEYQSLIDLISTNNVNFSRHKSRLQIVREKKNRPLDDICDDGYGYKDSDLYSDAGSTVASSTSRSSGKTFRSSKNRRKHERKVASLKEGSQYEDVALVIALHTLVTATHDLRQQVREVNTALTCFGKDKEAMTLQLSLEKLLKTMKDSFKEIWSNEFMLEVTNAAIAACNVPEGCNIIPQGIATLEPHLRIAPVIRDISWKLEGFN